VSVVTNSVGEQSALNAHGTVASQTVEITWILIGGATVIFIAVMAIMLYAVFARRSFASRLSEDTLIIGGGVIFPCMVLTALLIYSLFKSSALSPNEDVAALHVEIVGEQWWWRVHYLDKNGDLDFALANELRMPVGRTVVLHLKSADVIHSFWVPALAGKLDMIPGRTNILRVKADRPGRMRGQCAEYCGGPHALMALPVVAETPENYVQWAEGQRKPQRMQDLTSNSGAVLGQRIFLQRCAACHTVRGTPAAGVLGPDLTHIGSRLTLGAGLLPVNAGTLAGWIVSTQHLKPGNLMPEFRHFTGEELRAVSNYLGGLR
jgi:cytochrome c oxidase subunit 2